MSTCLPSLKVCFFRQSKCVGHNGLAILTSWLTSIEEIAQKKAVPNGKVRFARVTCIHGDPMLRSLTKFIRFLFLGGFLCVLATFRLLLAIHWKQYKSSDVDGVVPTEYCMLQLTCYSKALIFVVLCECVGFFKQSLTYHLAIFDACIHLHVQRAFFSLCVYLCMSVFAFIIPWNWLINYFIFLAAYTHALPNDVCLYITVAVNLKHSIHRSDLNVCFRFRSAFV